MGRTTRFFTHPVHLKNVEHNLHLRLRRKKFLTPPQIDELRLKLSQLDIRTITLHPDTSPAKEFEVVARGSLEAAIGFIVDHVQAIGLPLVAWRS